MQWFRFYTETLNNPKVQKLDGETFKSWINILCFAAQNDGVICDGNGDVTDLSFALRCENNAVTTLLERLSNAGLIDRVNGGANGWHLIPHEWDEFQYKSDTSKERQRRYRERHKKRNGDVTVTAQEQIQNRTEQNKEIKKKNGVSHDENFETFFTKFPTQRKGSRDKARPAWESAIKRDGPEIILRGLEAYLASNDVAGGFAKGAAAWLNDDGWKNNYRPPQTSSAPKQTLKNVVMY